MSASVTLGPHRLPSLLMAAIVLILLMSACASKNPKAPELSGSYKALLERQKAGMSLDENTMKNPPQMSVEEYERLGDTYIRQGNMTMAFAQYDRSLRMDQIGR